MSLESIRAMSKMDAIAEARKLYARLSRSTTPRDLSIRLAELDEVWGVASYINPYTVPKDLQPGDPRVCLVDLKQDLLEYWLHRDVEFVVQRASNGRATLFELVRALDAVEYNQRDLAEFLNMPLEEINELRNRLLVKEVEVILAKCADDTDWMMGGDEIEYIISNMDIWHDFWPEDGPKHVIDIAIKMVELAGEIHRYDLNKLDSLV